MRAIHFSRMLGFAAFVFSSHAGAATPIAVAPGCTAPAIVAGHHTYYIDPVHGSMSGDGSAAHPWHTLQEVYDVHYRLVANAPTVWIAGEGTIKPNPNAPIKSGDTLYLMSGNHGSLLLQGNFGTNNLLYGYDNSDFVTIAAAPNQTPVVTQLTFKGANKFIFQGITFQNVQNVPNNHGRPFAATNAGTSDFYLITLVGPNSNVIFNQNHLLSQGDTFWTSADYLSKRVSGIVAIGGSCFSITENNIEKIGFGIGTQRGTNVLIAHNTIDHFADDGIDYGSSNLVIDGNRITNSIEDNDGFHRDGMQGSPFGNTPVSNVQITNNVVINQTQPLPAAGNLQGIDAFDGVWQNLLVENNIVVTNSYNGMTFAGVANLSLINNTVLGVNTGLGGITTWIDVSPSKSGTASSNVTVRNNIAPYFIITGVNAYVDHNMIATANVNYIKYFKPSTQIMAAALPANVFYNFDSKNFAYDVRLQSGSAVNSGSRAAAPVTDIRGFLRATIDLGAVRFGGSAVVALQ